MREEKRRRTRDDVPLPKKKRDDSPSVHSIPSTSNLSCSSKTRGHIPVSERQQFALLKLMETKEPSSERGSKRGWGDCQEREIAETPLEKPSPNTKLSQTPSTLPAPFPLLSSSTATTSSTLRPQETTTTAVSSSSLGRYHTHRASPTSSSHHSASSSSSQGGHARKKLSGTPSTTFGLSSGGRGEFALMRASQKGDLLTVKMLVKEGADVNEQDSYGRTALHECCSQNYSSLVSYLLCHNANTSIRAVPRGGSAGDTGTGDTPLHEAARKGHVRIIRFLLQHGADIKVNNANGERPIDLCPNEATQMAFKQNLSETSAPPAAGTATSSHGHSYRRGSEDFPTTPWPPRRNSPETITNAFPPSSSSSSTHHKTSHSPRDRPTGNNQHHSPTSTRRNTASNPPGGGIQNPNPVRPDTKKDPYAFDDEELELSGQDASAGNTSKTHTATTTSPSQSNTSTSQPPRHASNTGTTATAQSPSTESLLHEVQPSSTTEGIAVSPSSGSGSGAPPLKLRFAMESGHYTVMENQEQAQAGVVNSPTTETDVLQLETFTTQETEKATDKIEQEDADALSISEANLMPEDGAVCKKVADTTEEDSRYDIGDNDTSRSQKVPPLRIKLATTSPSSSPAVGQSDQATSTAVAPTQEFSAELSVKSEAPETATTKSEEIKVHELEGEKTEDGKNLLVPRPQTPLLVGAATSSGVGPVRRGKMPKNTSSASLGSRSNASSESNARMRLVDSGSLNSTTIGDSRGKETGIKVEETPKSRSSRTLRSHTAAQREKEEREKHPDVAPPKKRKYRRGAGNHNTNSSNSHHSGSGNSATDQGDGVASGGGGETVDGGDTSQGDNDSNAGNDQVRPSSAASTTDNAADSEDHGLSTAGHDGSRQAKVFDDPTKPSSSGWGENPYDKAAELNADLSKLIGQLVELQPKEPAGYQDYLLVTREYLLADRIPQHISRRPCPQDLPPQLVELFEEQEEERYAQALKHQSEREQLRLCAEQSVLRAQTRATIALANQPRPLSFCSVMALKGFTYLPPFKGSEQRDEESVRDRFKARTLIGWLQDIKDNFHLGKKKLLCRQLHEAESLMMVQKLDWEVKLKELHFCDYGANIFDQIKHVPQVDVPNDFPLFVHDPIQRPI